MSRLRTTRVMSALSALCLTSTLSLQGCGSDGDGSVKRQALTAACIDDATLASEEDWLCPEPFLMECNQNASDGQIVYVTPPEGQTCSTVDPQVDPGPYAPGVHTVAIRDGESEVLCTSELIVVDTSAPMMDLSPMMLWPPNHKMVTVTAADCGTITDACDPSLSIFFTSVSSSELPDALGDGHTEPDIDVVDCETIRLRAERSGTGMGRMYELGVTAIDAQGLVTTGTCEVIVPHDSGPLEMMGRSEPAYHVVVPDCEGQSGGAAGAANMMGNE